MIALGAGLAIAFLFVSEKLGPKKITKEKLSTYESGMEPVGEARRRFTVKFYMVAMSFIIFDVEALFLYPFAVKFKTLPLSAVIGMAVFFVLLLGPV